MAPTKSSMGPLAMAYISAKPVIILPHEWGMSVLSVAVALTTAKATNNKATVFISFIFIFSVF